MNFNSKIILGTVQFGLKYGVNNQFGQTSFEEVNAIFNYARDREITTLDTANAYGNSEEVIGNYHKLSHSNPFRVASKFNVNKDVNVIVKETLQRLNIKKLFAFSFHSYEFMKQSPVNSINQLLNLQQEGAIGYLGISIYTNQQLKEVMELDWVNIIQLPYNLLDKGGIKDDLINEARQKGKIIHTRSVYLQGLFYMNPDSLPEKLHPLQKSVKEIQNISQELNIPISALALSYVLQKPFINNVIIGVETRQQLMENLDSIILLNKSVIEQLDKIEVSASHLLNPANWN